MLTWMVRKKDIRRRLEKLLELGHTLSKLHNGEGRPILKRLKGQGHGQTRKQRLTDLHGK